MQKSYNELTKTVTRTTGKTARFCRWKDEKSSLVSKNGEKATHVALTLYLATLDVKHANC